MANPIQLLFQTKDYKIGSIIFDLLLDENHNFSNEITEHDVEDGSVITDHIKNNLFAGTMTGFVTNFSMNRSFRLDELFTNRVQDAFDALEQLWKERTPVTIVTILKTYEDVGIENFNIPKNQGTGDSLFVSISFKQMNIVKLKTVDIDVPIKIKDMKTPLKRKSAKTLDKGQTTPGEVNLDLPTIEQTIESNNFGR